MYAISISPDELEKLPRAAFEGQIDVIDRLDDGRFEEAVQYLSQQEVIGFDTESRPTFSPDQPNFGTSLLQLSGADRAFLFRIKHIGIPESLCKILADPKILKIGAAVADDIHGLQRRHGFQPAGFVDLQKIGWEYGIREKGVKKMAAIILGVRISKTQQLSNWEAEHLSESQRSYAATDAWICREMYLHLMQAEKHPLTLEERDPEKALSLKHKAERAARAEEQRQAMLRKSAARRRRDRNRRRRLKMKKKNSQQDDSQAVPQEGQG